MSVKFLEQLNRNVVRFPLSGKISPARSAAVFQNLVNANHNTPNYDNSSIDESPNSGISPTFAVDLIEYAENIPILGWFFEHIPRPVVIK